MADDLEDTGPAGGNPNASRSQPNFPDADDGGSSGGGGGGAGGGGGSDDDPDFIRQARRRIEGLFGGTPAETESKSSGGKTKSKSKSKSKSKEPTQTTSDGDLDSGGDVVDRVDSAIDEAAATVDGATDTARDLADEAGAKVSEPANSDTKSGSASNGQSKTAKASKTKQSTAGKQQSQQDQSSERASTQQPRASGTTERAADAPGDPSGLPDRGPAGSNPDATRSRPNFPDQPADPEQAGFAAVASELAERNAALDRDDLRVTDDGVEIRDDARLTTTRQNRFDESLAESDVAGAERIDDPNPDIERGALRLPTENELERARDRARVDAALDSLETGRGQSRADVQTALPEPTQQAIAAIQQEERAETRQQAAAMVGIDATSDGPATFEGGNPLAGALTGEAESGVSQQPLQQSQAEGVTAAGGGGFNQSVANDLTRGGFLAEGTRELDQSGEVQSPEEIPDGADPAQFLEREIAERNPGIDESDVEVRGTIRGEYDVDIDVSAAERVAAANDDLTPSEVRFTQTEDGLTAVTETGGIDPLSGEFVPNEEELRKTGQTIQSGVEDVSAAVGAAVGRDSAAGGIAAAQEISTEEEQFDDNALSEGVIEPSVMGANLLNAPQRINEAETATEVITNLPSETLENTEAVGATAAAAGTAAASQGVEAVTERPLKTGSRFAAEAGIGAALSPLRATSIKLPTPDGGSQAVRGLRLNAPPAARALADREFSGRTIVGQRGRSVTTGAPAADPEDIDFSQLGTRTDQTVEPTGPFETEVFDETIEQSAGSDAVSRVRTRRRLLEEAASADAGDVEADSLEDVVGRAVAAPEDRTEEIADALRETESTVFGSAAAASQVEGFRAPRDIDVAVENPSRATERFSQALEGSNADVQDVFDIKSAEEVPARVSGGEFAKFGRISEEPIEFDGSRINPVTEELTRKVGASAFVRDRGAAGTDELDVGPQPRRPGRSDVRQKDIDDASVLGRELLGEENRAVREFEAAFDVSERDALPTDDTSRVADEPLVNPRLDPDAERTAAGFGAVRRGDTIDTTPEPDIGRRVDPDTGSSPSTGGRDPIDETTTTSPVGRYGTTSSTLPAFDPTTTQNPFGESPSPTETVQSGDEFFTSAGSQDGSAGGNTAFDPTASAAPSPGEPDRDGAFNPTSPAGGRGRIDLPSPFGGGGGDDFGSPFGGGGGGDFTSPFSGGGGDDFGSPGGGGSTDDGGFSPGGGGSSPTSPPEVPGTGLGRNNRVRQPEFEEDSDDGPFIFQDFAPEEFRNPVADADDIL